MSQRSGSGSNNIAATIFRDLRKQILRGELSPGTRLPGERELAAEYNTNRNTLREAVRLLEHARLITVRHGQGVTVTDFRKAGTLELMLPFLENASDSAEVAKLLGDILPVRLLVLEFATALAAERADREDLRRLKDITELVIAAFERRDPTLIAHGFQSWLDALIDAGHSLAVRWIANPFLEAYRELMDRFPALWILEPSFPEYLREFTAALEIPDAERALACTRSYYRRVDSELIQALATLLQAQPRTPKALPEGEQG